MGLRDRGVLGSSVLSPNTLRSRMCPQPGSYRARKIRVLTWKRFDLALYRLWKIMRYGHDLQHVEIEDVEKNPALLPELRLLWFLGAALFHLPSSIRFSSKRFQDGEG